jgi:hypothetical protein
MLADNSAVLADHDAVCIGMDFDRAPDRAGGHRVLIVLEAHQGPTPAPRGSRRTCRHRHLSSSQAFISSCVPQPWCEEVLANEADLVLDLALLPARSWRAGDRIDEVMTAHLQEAPIVETILADEDGLHLRLYVVADAASAGSLEQREAGLWASNTISSVSRGYLLDGIDWRAPQRTWRRTAAG